MRLVNKVEKEYQSRIIYLLYLEYTALVFHRE